MEWAIVSFTLIHRKLSSSYEASSNLSKIHLTSPSYARPDPPASRAPAHEGSLITPCTRVNTHTCPSMRVCVSSACTLHDCWHEHPVAEETGAPRARQPCRGHPRGSTDRRQRVPERGGPVRVCRESVSHALSAF